MNSEMFEGAKYLERHNNKDKAIVLYNAVIRKTYSFPAFLRLCHVRDSIGQPLSSERDDWTVPTDRLERLTHYLSLTRAIGTAAESARAALCSLASSRKEEETLLAIEVLRILPPPFDLTELLPLESLHVMAMVSRAWRHWMLSSEIPRAQWKLGMRLGLGIHLHPRTWRKTDEYYNEESWQSIQVSLRPTDSSVLHDELYPLSSPDEDAPFTPPVAFAPVELLRVLCTLDRGNVTRTDAQSFLKDTTRGLALVPKASDVKIPTGYRDTRPRLALLEGEAIPSRSLMVLMCSMAATSCFIGEISHTEGDALGNTAWRVWYFITPSYTADTPVTAEGMEFVYISNDGARSASFY